MGLRGWWCADRRSIAAGRRADVTLELHVRTGVVTRADLFTGDSWDDASPRASAVDSGGGVWTATAILPQPLPGSLLVRIGMADGAVLETSPVDLPLHD